MKADTSKFNFNKQCVVLEIQPEVAIIIIVAKFFTLVKITYILLKIIYIIFCVSFPVKVMHYLTSVLLKITYIIIFSSFL